MSKKRRKAKSAPVSPSIAPAIMESVKETIPPKEPTTLGEIFGESETPCARIRRLAQEQLVLNNILTTKLDYEFVANVCGDIPFEGPNKDGVYKICGYEWRLTRWPTPTLRTLFCVSTYKNISIRTRGEGEDVRSNGDLGKSLLLLDANLEKLKSIYPDTWWGNINAWINAKIL